MAIIPTPPQVTFGKFVGRFADIIGDTTNDVDHYPEFVPVSGSVIFTPEIPGTGLKLIDANPKLTAGMRPVTATLDSSGYLVDPTGNPGVWLVASDSDAGNDNYFTWSVTLAVEGITRRTITGVYLPTWVQAGDEVDLFDIIPADPSQPVYVGSDPLVAAMVLDPSSQTRAAILSILPSGGNNVTTVNGRTGNVTGLAEQVDLFAVSNAQTLLAPKANPIFTGLVTVPTTTNAAGAINKGQLDTALSGLGSGTVPDASSTVKGKTLLGNMLGGTADAPTVPALLGGTTGQYLRGGTQPTWQTLDTAAVTGLTAALAGKEPTVIAGTAVQYLRGDKTWQPFTGLPVSTAQAAADEAVRVSVEGGRGPAVTATGVTGAVSLTADQIKGSRTMTLTGNVVLTLPTMPANQDASLTLYIIQGTGGSRLITWPSAVRWVKATKPTLSTTLGQMDLVTLLWSGTFWTGLFGGDQIA